MTIIEYRDSLAKSMIKDFVSEFKEKTGLRISISIHDDYHFKKNYITDLDDLPVISLHSLEKIVLNCIPYKITHQQFKSKNRQQKFVDPRSLFCIIARKLNFKYKSIGEYLKRDHTSIIHLEKKAFNLLDTEVDYLEIHNLIINKIREKYGEII